MPDLDGYETAELIRSRERSRQTPIIFLTANYRSDAHVFRGYSVGAVDYIFKPFSPEILKSKVAVFVELYQKREALKRQAQALLLAHEELEDRVRARTRELAETNTALRDEVDERKRIEARAPGAARERAARPRARRGRQPPEGRVPRHAVARAAHAAERDSRLVAPADVAQGRSGDGGARHRRHPQQRHGAVAADRGHPRRLADHRRQAAAQARRACRCTKSSRRRSIPCRRPPRPRRIDDRPRHRRHRADHRRPRSPAAGGLEPALERRQVHAARGPRHRPPEAASTTTWCSRVEDTGIGISPDFLPYVFDRFRQADGSATRRHGGLGLGMAIVRHLVELHGGTVRADSAGESRGATFTIDTADAPRGDRGRRRRSRTTPARHDRGGRRVSTCQHLDGVSVWSWTTTAIRAASCANCSRITARRWSPSDSTSEALGAFQAAASRVSSSATSACPMRTATL